jgi:5'-phosphate synthase pdxT subunit
VRAVKSRKSKVDAQSVERAAKVKIGILAVQGDYEAHGKVLAGVGIEHVFVRTPADLAGVEGLILPGGESTTHLKFLQEEGLADAIRQFVAKGRAVFGTCAGAILLARDVRNPSQPSLGLADLVVARNAYGRQVASEVRWEFSKLKPVPLEMVFIRAPIIEQVGPSVEVLAESAGRPVLVRDAAVLVATFHPELTADTAVHEYFLKLAGERSEPEARSAPEKIARLS